MAAEGRTFVQRALASADEQAQVLEQLRDQGVDPNGKQAGGHLHGAFWLSRPAQDVAEITIERLLSA